MNVNQFMKILDSSYLNTEFEESSLLYVSGYAAFSVKFKISCCVCASNLESDDSDGSYVSDINRGGLTLPSEMCIAVGRHVFCIGFELRVRKI